MTNFYEIHGGNNPKTIVMIHGAGVTCAWLNPQTMELSKEYRVIALDLPGHGTLAGERFSMEASLERLKSLFEAEIPDHAILMGVSLGGYLAINFAHLYPERVSGLILCGSSINMSGLTGISFKLTGFLLKRKGADWLKEVTVASYRKRVAAEIIEPIIEAGFFAEAAVDAFFQTSGINFHKMLKAYSGPILVANGEKDEVNRKAEPALAKVVPHAQFSPISEASHLTNLEQPEEFNRVVTDFLKKLN
ncbi:MAG TPA: alpha/beta hydrolase [Anaerolineales bacterium]